MVMQCAGPVWLHGKTMYLGIHTDLGKMGANEFRDCTGHINGAEDGKIPSKKVCYRENVKFQL